LNNLKKPYIAKLIDGLSIYIGNIISWLTLIIVIITAFIVVLRYVFNLSPIWLQESLIWVHGIIFMCGSSYTLQNDSHVRVDVVYRKLDKKQKTLINLLGTILFIFPFCFFLFSESLEYVISSWQIKEVSRNSGGMIYPFIPILKTSLLIMPITIFLQGISIVTTSLNLLRKT